MKRYLMSTLCAGMICGTAAMPVSAALVAGDIALIGAYMDGTSNDATGGGDAFAWVPLVNLSAGEVIHFSDAGFHTTGSLWGNTEGLLTFTVPAGGINAGTVQLVSNATVGDLSLAGLVTAGTGYTTGASAYSAGAHVNLSGAGDQIVAFTDGDVSDTAGFTGLYGLNLASTDWAATMDNDGVAVDSNQTNLYPGLVDGTSAVAVGSGTGNQDEFDNSRYIGITTGTQAALLAAISDPANWEGINTIDPDPAVSRDWVANGVTQFNVVPEPASMAMMALGGLAMSLRRRG